jgi:hypothetical protein
MKEPSKRDIPRDNSIGQYLHCAKCIAEWKTEKGAGESPQTYSRIQVGFTKIGLQIWCFRHDLNIAHIDFEGQQHPANLQP